MLVQVGFISPPGQRASGPSEKAIQSVLRLLFPGCCFPAVVSRMLFLMRSLSIEQEGRAAGWAGLCPSTLTLITYHDVVPATDGFPLIHQEIASCLAFAALDDAMVVTIVAMIWLAHPNSL